MSLAREIVAALPRMMAKHPKGPRAKDIAAFMACPEENVRRAMEAIKAQGLAIVVRYPGSKARCVVPLKHFPKTQRACAHCDVFFEVKEAKDRRRCCSRSHGIAWSWSRPGVKEKRLAGIREARQRPEEVARLAEHNKRRWSKPEERYKLAEQNRREWADPVKKAKRSAAIQAAHGTPEKRKFYSETRKRQWKEKEFREKTLAGIRKSKRSPQARAQFSALLRERWKDPVMRAKYTAHNQRLNAERSERMRKRMLNESDEQRAKRVAASHTPEATRKRNETRLRRAAERGYYRHPNENKGKRKKPAR